VLRAGDIVGVDVALIVDGFHGDNAATVAWRDRRARAPAPVRDARGAAARDRGGAAGRAARRHRPRDPVARRAARLLGRARLRRHGVGPPLPRGAAGAALRRGGCGPAPARGTHLHDRADDQRGRARDRDPRRRLDREDRRSQPVRAVRAHARGDRRRRARAHRAQRQRRVGAAGRLLATRGSSRRQGAGWLRAMQRSTERLPGISRCSW
jgi:hypothetical protein